MRKLILLIISSLLIGLVSAELEEVILNQGNSIIIDGKTLKVNTISSSSVVITVDGVTEFIDEGESETINNVDIVVSQISYSDDREERSVILSLDGDITESILDEEDEEDDEEGGDSQDEESIDDIIKELEKKVLALELDEKNKITELEKKVLALELDEKNKITELENKLLEIEGELEDDRDYYKNKKRIRELETRLLDLQEKLEGDEKVKEMVSLQEDIDKLQEDITELKKENKKPTIRTIVQNFWSKLKSWFR